MKTDSYTTSLFPLPGPESGIGWSAPHSTSLRPRPFGIAQDTLREGSAYAGSENLPGDSRAVPVWVGMTGTPGTTRPSVPHRRERATRVCGYDSGAYSRSLGWLLVGLRWCARVPLIALLFLLGSPSAFAVVCSSSGFTDPSQNYNNSTYNSRSALDIQRIENKVKAAYPDDSELDRGILDVSKAPYYVKPGSSDITCKLQRALLDARDVRAVAYVPPGSYVITGQLICIQGRIEDIGDDPTDTSNTGETKMNSKDFPCVIQGATNDVTTLVLAAPCSSSPAPCSTGFDNLATGKIKAMLFFASRQKAALGGDLNGNVSFNQMILNLTLEIRSAMSGRSASTIRGRRARSSRT